MSSAAPVIELPQNIRTARWTLLVLTVPYVGLALLAAAGVGRLPVSDRRHDGQTALATAGGCA
ncbi:hypothetical protein [Micromonospora zhanjiangensis]|uniref:Uncharacterized protein n=1 Tax=Micromonospora zhanjiangensis TaxID=1522057 RepID=A0ABV8KJJ9_9ACTN